MVNVCMLCGVCLVMCEGEHGAAPRPAPPRCPACWPAPPESCVFALQGGGWAGRLPAVPVTQARLSGGFPTLPGIQEGEAGVYGVMPAPPPPPPVTQEAPSTWPKRSATKAAPRVFAEGLAPRPSAGGAAAVWGGKRTPTTAVCSVCFKDFMYPSALTLHMRTHTGEKPFTCPHPQCDYRSTKKGNLKRHASTHGEAFLATLEL